jgi:hypothetical protein
MPGDPSAAHADPPYGAIPDPLEWPSVWRPYGSSVVLASASVCRCSLPGRRARLTGPPQLDTNFQNPATGDRSTAIALAFKSRCEDG